MDALVELLGRVVAAVRRHPLPAAAVSAAVVVGLVIPLLVVDSGPPAKTKVSTSERTSTTSASAASETSSTIGSGGASTTLSASSSGSPSRGASAAPARRGSSGSAGSGSPGSHPTVGGWHAQALPSGAQALMGVSCVDGGFCVSVGSSILTTTDYGAHWTSQTMPPLANSNDRLLAASCISNTTCWSVSVYAVMLKTTDGGRTWARENLPSGYNLAFGVWCLGPDHCWASAVSGAASAIVRTTDGGATWTASPVPPETGSANGGACATLLLCWAGGTSPEPPNYVGSGPPALYESTDGGATWTVGPRFSMPSDGKDNYINDVSCSGPQTCTAVGIVDRQGADQPVLASTNDGKNWTLEPTPPGVPGLDGVSCTSGGCWAVGQSWSGSTTGSVIVESAATGSAATVRFTTTAAYLPAIACVPSGPCWAVGKPSGPQQPPAAVFSDVTT